jgi:hypothetical protein
MAEMRNVSRSNGSGEDAITAAWLEDEGPYVTLSSRSPTPEDEEPEANRNLVPTRVE